ncbi:MAG: hypothetical protein IJZ42_08685 [Lachnospiraceae bacterium]|nr:hypothetical protein [Lachnospiraceae bacterium]
MSKQTKYISIICVMILVLSMTGCNQVGEMLQSYIGDDVVASEQNTDTEVEEEIEEESEEEEASESNEEPEELPVPELSAEEALSGLVTDDFVIKEDVGEALYYYASPQRDAVDFTGEWNRTNVPTYYYGHMDISNQDETGFQVVGDCMWFSHSGVIEGKAYFVTKDIAVYRFYNEYASEDDYQGYGNEYEYIVFEKTANGLFVYATGSGGAIGAGANCFVEGEYVSGDPVYTNANILKETYTDAQLAAIEKLVGDELYEDIFVITTENGQIECKSCQLEDESLGTFYSAYIPGIADYNYYSLIICDNGDIYCEIGPDGEFYTNVDNAAEMPEYEYVEVHMSYEEFKTYLNEEAPNMAAGDVVSLSIDLDYYFALGEWAENFDGNALQTAYALRHPGGKTFLLICYDLASHDFVTVVYDITGDEIVQCDKWELTEIIGDEISVDKITLSHTFNVLGTNWCEKEYALDENGKLVTETEGYYFTPMLSEWWEMRVIKELPVVIDGRETVINTGDHIVITGTNMKSHMDLEGEIYLEVVETGETGTIFFEREMGEYGPGPYMIDGVSEYDYFEWLPYAG